MAQDPTRVYFFSGPVMPERAFDCIRFLLDCDSRNHKEITIYIDSPGGNIVDGLAVADTMNLIKSPVRTICLGLAASMGSILLCSGEKGRRAALPNSRIMIHQPLQPNGVYGTYHDMREAADGLTYCRDVLEQIIAKASGQPLEKVHEDCGHDNYLTAQEALEYGLIDEIIETVNR